MPGSHWIPTRLEDLTADVLITSPSSSQVLQWNGTTWVNATVSVPTGASPSASVGLTAVDGIASTFMTSDSAPPLSQSIAPTWSGVHTFAPAARTSGHAPFLQIQTPADTGLSAATECIGAQFGGSSSAGTVTRQFGTGAIALQRENLFVGPTYAFAAASTITEADTLYVKAPLAGTNATLTRSSAIVSEGQLTVREVSGTAGTDEIQLFHDGTNGWVLAATGILYLAKGNNNSVELLDASTNMNVQLQSTSNGGNIVVARSSGQLLAMSGSTTTAYFGLCSSGAVQWSVNNNQAGANPDTALVRNAANVIGVTNGSSGKGWLQNSAGRARLTAPVTNATATMANLSDLTVTLIAGRKYFGRMVLFGNNSTGAEGLQFDFNGGTATLTSIEYGFPAQPVSATVGTATSTAAGTALTCTSVATTDVAYAVDFELVCNAAGTLIPRFAEVSHTSGTATINNGYLMIEDSPN